MSRRLASLLAPHGLALVIGITVLGGTTLAVPTEARASVSILASLDELVELSERVVVGTPQEHQSRWEDLPSGRRIVTYTRVKIDTTVAGAKSDEVWVRTLGGAVGRVGQQVAGEARLTRGERALLFLSKAGQASVVAAMAQGHYPVLTDAKGNLTLKGSPDVGALVPRPGPVLAARDQLVGAKLERALELVRSSARALEARRAKGSPR